MRSSAMQPSSTSLSRRKAGRFRFPTHGEIFLTPGRTDSFADIHLFAQVRGSHFGIEAQISVMPAPSQSERTAAEQTTAAKIGAALFRHRSWLPIFFLVIVLFAPSNISASHWI